MALTVSQTSSQPGGATPPATCAFSSTVSTGVIVCGLWSSGNGGSAGSLTVSDNVNIGNYSLITNFYSSLVNASFGLFWKPVNTSGTPTLALVEGSGTFGYIVAINVTGFIGTPTPDVGITAQWAASGTAQATSGVQTIGNNEIVFLVNSQTGGAYPGGWTDFSSHREMGWKIVATAGTNADFAGSVSSGPWMIAIGGIYDAPNLGASWINAPLGPSLALPFNPTQFSGRFGGPGFPYATQNPPSGNIWGRHISHSRHRRN